MTQPNIRLIIIIFEIILAFALSIAIAYLGLGSVAWIFGGMGGGLIAIKCYQYITKKTFKPHKIGRQIGQAMVGLSIGFAIAENNLIAASAQLPLFIFLTVFMFVCGGAIGYAYARISRTNLLNAMLATVPGGVATMSSIAAEYNRNVSLVAMVQTLRITSVILIIPLIAGTSGTITNKPIFALQDYAIAFNPIYLIELTLAIICAIVGVKIAIKLKIPASSFFGTLIVGIIFNHSISAFNLVPNFSFTPPQIISILGQILLGITVGEAWSEKVYLTGKSLIYALMAVALTIVSGLIAATIAFLITSWDWLTCMLITAPGGSTEMILVALALDRNPEIVTVAHTVRLMALNLSLPLWIFWLRKWEGNVGH